MISFRVRYEFKHERNFREQVSSFAQAVGAGTLEPMGGKMLVLPHAVARKVTLPKPNAFVTTVRLESVEPV